MSDSFKLLFAGDAFPVAANIPLFRKGDIEAIFGSRVCELFQAADYSVCNLEGCLTDNGTPVDKVGPSVKAPTDTLNGFAALGLNAATMANTHTMDYGRAGHDEMRAALSRYHIDCFGTGDTLTDIRSHISAIHNGVTVTLYTVTELFSFNTPADDHPGAKPYDEYAVCCELAALKEQCDYLVVLYHGGAELTHYNTPLVRSRFHRMADNGADIIISQHTHAVGLEEYYNGAYLLYGQGNFCFNLSKAVNEFTAQGILLEVDFTKDGFDVKKHLVRRTDTGCVYDEDQDLTAFEERSRLHDRLLCGDKEAAAVFDREFDRVCQSWMPRLMGVLRGDNPQDKAATEGMTPQEIGSYLLSQYSKRQLLGILMMLTNDEFNEITAGFVNAAIRQRDNEEQ